MLDLSVARLTLAARLRVDSLRLSVAADGAEGVTRLRNVLQSEYNDWRGGRGFADALTDKVGHRLDPPPGLSNQQGIALPQRPALDQQGRTWALTAVELSLVDDASGCASGIRT